PAALAAGLPLQLAAFPAVRLDPSAFMAVQKAMVPRVGVALGGAGVRQGQRLPRGPDLNAPVRGDDRRLASAQRSAELRPRRTRRWDVLLARDVGLSTERVGEARRGEP